MKKSSSSLRKLHTSCPLIKSGFYLLYDAEAIFFHYSIILQKLSPVEFMSISGCSHELGMAALSWPDLKFIDSSTFPYLFANLGSQTWETLGISAGCLCAVPSGSLALQTPLFFPQSAPFRQLCLCKDKHGNKSCGPERRQVCLKQNLFLESEIRAARTVI